MTGFDDTEIPLINGTVRGLRAFTINEDGTLTSIVIGSGKTAYTEGINHAKCEAVRNMYSPDVTRWLISQGWIQDHRAPDKLCNCGIYAYFNETHVNGETNFVYSSYRRVVGIVEGSGRCIVGDEGFRAEKIKIVALVDDTSRDPLMQRKPKQIFNDAARSMNARFASPKFGLHVLLPVILIQILLTALGVALDIHVLTSISFYVSMMLMASALFSAYGSYVEFNDIFPSTAEIGQRTGPPPKNISEKIRKQYPNIAHYRTLDAARSDFPLSNRITS